MTREFIASHGLADRVSAVAGDFTRDPLPAGSDVMIMASSLPQYSREIIQAVVSRAFAALGPMTGTIPDNSLLLEVIAGADGYDPRQYSPKVHSYTEALGRGVDGLKIGLVKEGFGLPNSERDEDVKVRKAGELVSVPSGSWGGWRPSLGGYVTVTGT